MVYKLGDLVTVSSNNYSQKDDWEKFIYLDTSNLTDNVVDQVITYNNYDELPSRARQKTDVGNILFSSVRPNQKHYGYFSEKVENLLVSTGFIILKPKVNYVCGKYIYYFLTQDTVIGQLQTIAESSKSSYPAITNNDLLELQIDLPSLDEQLKIVNILSMLEKQIAQNNAMVKKLQVLARGVYNHWFLQFQYPNEEEYSFKKLTSDFIYNNELNKKIPIGWEVKTLGDLITKQNEVHNYKNNLHTVDLSVMPSGNIALDTLNKSFNFTTNLYAMEEGNILFGSIRPYLKKCGVAPCNGAVAGTVFQFKPKLPHYFNYSLITMSQDFFFNYAIKVSKGTKMPVISDKDVLSFKLVFNEKIVEKFNNLPLLRVLTRTVMMNIKLNDLKNRLLPLLINQQLY